MPQLFHPSLINCPGGDPGLFIPFFFSKRAILFDLGNIYSLSSRDLLKVSHAFISHTHMDHFSGFDHLLRIFLGRRKTLFLYGPEGFLNNLDGKLNGYSWNLVNNYTDSIILHATEVKNDSLISRRYECQHQFKPRDEDQIQSFHHKIIHDEPLLSVSATILDHGISALGFSIQEKFKINIRKDVLIRLGLTPGPWLNNLKQAVYDNHDPNEIIGLPGGNSSTLKELSEQIAIITKGQKITYITDIAYTASNVERMVELAKDSDQLFIESAFLDKDKALAEKKYHLTAKQAGKITAMAGAKRFSLFHFSPRYCHYPKDVFYTEAMAEYIKYRTAKE